MDRAIGVARETLAIEIEGLNALRTALDGDHAAGLARAFLKAMDLIRAASGRVIVTGMGKSGHIGRKIAATLASTGEPASFVHPAEASHGDLGMISRADVVIALSNSGETPELADIIAYCARFSIPLIAITSGAESVLARAADVVLLLPPVREACEETRAPTTSTTMTLALGDALAVALLREKGFTAQDFRGFHPGGKLGSALRKVSDLMRGPDALPLCALATPVPEVIAVINRFRLGCVGVIDTDGHLVGMVTDGDLRRHHADLGPDRTVEEIMTRAPITIAPDTLAAEALNLLSEKLITSLFVVEEGRPVGILHVHDCLSTGVV